MTDQNQEFREELNEQENKISELNFKIKELEYQLSISQNESADSKNESADSKNESEEARLLKFEYEAEIDKVMSRTCLRPLPLGKITSLSALWFGIILSIVSVVGLYVVSNLLSAVVLALTILFYYFVYTVWLKRKTTQNIVIGGAAGAFPPIIGWTIAMNNISIEPIVLFLIIFFWTPSHFWALSLYKNDDYKKANIPMLSVIAGEEYTKKNIFIYSIILFPISLIPFYYISLLIFLN